MKIVQLFLLLCAPFVLRAAPTPMDAWRIELLDAPTLRDNILGDDARVRIGVHLPPSYADTGERRYPVIYSLLGYGRNSIPQMEMNRGILDDLYRAKSIPECITVFVSGQTRLFGSFYVDSEVNGGWEHFVTETLIAHIDQTYRTLAKRESRAITGNSMGGFGALNIAMKHPNLYNVCYAMSPGLYDENGLAESQMFHNGGTTKEILALLERLAPLPDEEARKVYFDYIAACKDNNVMFTLTYSTAFSPAPKRAPYFNYPVRMGANGNLVRDEILWKKYESGFGNVRDELRQYGENFRMYTSVTLDCGMNETYPWIFTGTAYFTRLLTELRIPHTMVWHDGTHGSRRDRQFQTTLMPTVANHLAHK